MAEIHPGSFVGDTVEEWKKLPTWGKIAIGVLLVGVAAYALYQRSQGQTAQQAAASTAGTPGGSATGGQSPFPMVGNLPVLPSNVNPVYDSSGNPVAFQQSPPPVPTPTPTPTPTPPPGVKPKHKPKPPPGSDVDTRKKKPGFHTSPGHQADIQPGSVRGTPGGGSGGHMGSVSGGPVSPRTSQTHGTHKFMANPHVYHQAARPHVPSSVPQNKPFPVGGNVQFQNTPYGSGYGTVNGIPLTPPQF